MTITNCQFFNWINVTHLKSCFLYLLTFQKWCFRVAPCQFYPRSSTVTKALFPPPTEPACEKVLDVDFTFSSLPRPTTCEMSVKHSLYFLLAVFSLYLLINWCPTPKVRDLWLVYLHFCLGTYTALVWTCRALNCFCILTCRVPILAKGWRAPQGLGMCMRVLSSMALPSPPGMGTTSSFSSFSFPPWAFLLLGNCQRTVI